MDLELHAVLLPQPTVLFVLSTELRLALLGGLDGIA